MAIQGEEYLNSIPVNNPVPIHIINLTAERNNNTTATLRWNISNSFKQLNFIIEKSNDGRNFNNIGSIASTNTTFYFFIDKNANNRSAIHYRLKTIDEEGKIAYTPVIVVQNFKETNAVKVFPNPLQSQSWISIETTSAELVKITLFDASGKAIKQIQKQVARGSNLVALDCNALLKGTYTICINGTSINENIVVEK